MADVKRASLTVRGLEALAANFRELDTDQQTSVKNIVRKYGFLTRRRTYDLAPKPGPEHPYSQGHLAKLTEVRFSDGGYTYEAGWWRERFLEEGLKFYAPYVEEGTRNMEAQPSLGPADRQTRPEFEAALRDYLRQFPFRSRGGR